MLSPEERARVAALERVAEAVQEAPYSTKDGVACLIYTVQIRNALSALQAEAPKGCWICGKEKGQPPERCPGHYADTPSAPDPVREAPECHCDMLEIIGGDVCEIHKPHGPAFQPGPVNSLVREAVAERTRAVVDSLTAVLGSSDMSDVRAYMRHAYPEAFAERPEGGKL